MTYNDFWARAANMHYMPQMAYNAFFTWHAPTNTPIWHDKCHNIEWHTPVRPTRRPVLLERAAWTLDGLSMNPTPSLARAPEAERYIPAEAVGSPAPLKRSAETSDRPPTTCVEASGTIVAEASAVPVDAPVRFVGDIWNPAWSSPNPPRPAASFLPLDPGQAVRVMGDSSKSSGASDGVPLAHDAVPDTSTEPVAIDVQDAGDPVRSTSEPAGRPETPYEPESDQRSEAYTPTQWEAMHNAYFVQEAGQQKCSFGLISEFIRRVNNSF